MSFRTWKRKKTFATFCGLFASSLIQYNPEKCWILVWTNALGFTCRRHFFRLQVISMGNVCEDYVTASQVCQDYANRKFTKSFALAFHCSCSICQSSANIHRCCSSLLYTVFIWDDSIDCSMSYMISAAYRDDRHGRIMTACDALQLTVKARDVRRGY